MPRRGGGRVQGGWNAPSTSSSHAVSHSESIESPSQRAPDNTPITNNIGKPIFMRPRREGEGERPRSTQGRQSAVNTRKVQPQQDSSSGSADDDGAFVDEGQMSPVTLEAGREESCLLVDDLYQQPEVNNMSGAEAEACLQNLLSHCSTDLKDMKKSKAPILVWFRQDLRIADNPALYHASQTGRPVIPVFLHVPDEEGNWDYEGAAKLWLHLALEDLGESLAREFGSRLVVRSGGDSLSLLLDLLLETGASALLFNRVYEPWKIQRDAVVAETLSCNGVDLFSFKGVVLYEPLEVVPDRAEGFLHGFGSVGFFLSACEGRPLADPLPAPSALRAPPSWPASTPLASLGLAALPVRPDGTVRDWTVGIRAWWRRGEQGAAEALAEFVGHGCFKFEGRDRFRADRKHTAVISPYLRFGQLSPGTVMYEVRRRHGNRAKTFMRRLAWRDLAYWCLWKFPHMADAPLRPQYAHQKWDHAPKSLAAWQFGQTGYPLVDAAMRQLWVTGWMPNYMRHVVAGFLVEHLNLHWIEGLRWFHHTLVDADVAINAYMWQNGGHSGLDQWNFVMHPVYAAKSCDPDGDYTRFWVPELAALPSEYIHCPWEGPLSLLSACRVSLHPPSYSHHKRDRDRQPAHETSAERRRLRALAMESMPGAKRTQDRYAHRVLMDLEGARRMTLEAVLEVRRGAGKGMVLRDGNEGLRLEDGRVAVLITRKDYREMSKVPITNQTPDETRDPRRRPKRDPLSVAMADAQSGYDRLSAR